MSRSTFMPLIVAGLALCPLWPAVVLAQDASDGGIAAARGESDYEELTRGPIHEAFAEQFVLDPQPGIVVSKEPPEPVKELPPAKRPEGGNVIWIDGYWAFDDAEDRFIWVSGVWRVAPAGYAWVPGYWTKVDKGWQWIGGFWSDAEQSEVAYYPQPPDSLEKGPTSAAPSEEHFWVPGAWRYVENDYQWRPGYWSPGHDSWVWIPHYYRYTPRGYVYCGGYWDRPLTHRGFLFAPVVFHRPIYRTANWYYTPGVTIGLGNLHLHLWSRPTYYHYYFGDYYGYVDRGWYPWHVFHKRSYDPLFAFNLWTYKRHGIDFHNRYDAWYRYFERHQQYRPPHTYDKMREFVNRHRDFDHLRQVAMGDKFDDVVRQHRDRFVDLTADQRRNLFQGRERFEQFRQQRAQQEGQETRDGVRPTLRVPDDFRRAFLDRGRTSGRDATGRNEDRQRGEGRGERRVLRPNFDQDRFQRPDIDRGDIDRGDIDRGDRGDIDRGDINRGDINRGDINRGDINRGRIGRERFDRGDRIPPTQQQRPTFDRDLQRPEVQRPDVQRPEVQRPEVQRPEVQRPSIQRGDSRQRVPSFDRGRIETPPRGFDRGQFDRDRGPINRGQFDRGRFEPRDGRALQPSPGGLTRPDATPRGSHGIVPDHSQFQRPDFSRGPERRFVRPPIERSPAAQPQRRPTTSPRSQESFRGRVSPGGDGDRGRSFRNSSPQRRAGPPASSRRSPKPQPDRDD